MQQVVRNLVFPVVALPASLTLLLREFRLITNKCIRVAHAQDIRSRAKLQKAVYADLSAEHDIYKGHIYSTFEVAFASLKNYRRRTRKGQKTSFPYLRKLIMKTDNQRYRFNRETGRLCIPIRAGEHIELDLPLSDWHRSILSDPTWRLGSLTLIPGQVMVVVRKAAPVPYGPEGAIALDTNESSFDGVVAKGHDASLVTISFPKIREVQAIHFRRRRRLAKKKAHDRRVRRHLLAREGRREHNRVKQRLHLVSKGLIEAARERKAALVLEDLKMPQGGGRSRRTNRRLSSWPQGELHRQVEYKALAAGVPLIKINPKYTSKTCPRCMTRKPRRDRVGQVFECRKCGWTLDRQLNAGLNILNTALAAPNCADLARAVRFQPDALRKDEMIRLYDLPPMVAGAREDWSGVEGNQRFVGLLHDTSSP